MVAMCGLLSDRCGLGILVPKTGTTVDRNTGRPRPSLRPPPLMAMRTLELCKAASVDQQ